MNTSEPTSPPYSEERFHHFVDCVLDGKPSLALPEQSFAVQKASDAVYRSAATKQKAHATRCDCVG
jgi:predicted dehydrogenase